MIFGVNVMTSISVLLTLVFAIVLIKIAQLLYRRSKLVSIIDRIPGPKAYSILGNIPTILRIKRADNFIWIRGMCSQYKAGIFRIWLGWRPAVHLSTVETTSIVMRSKNLITKSNNYDFIHPWLGTGLITAAGEKWHRQRKLLMPTFHFNILEQYADVMSEKAEILKDCIALEMKNNPKNPLEVFDLLTKCALDVICESAMGVNINAQKEPDAEYYVALHSLTTQITSRIFRPWLYADWIYYRTSAGRKFKNNLDIVTKFSNQVIREKKLAREMQKQNPNDESYTDQFNKPKRRAFLDHLLDACERDNMLLTDEEVREEVDTFMFAGHDTTAGAMSWALFCIGNHPEVEEKIHEEQLQVFGDSTEPATLHQLSELKYLERVIKETLRLFPSVPSIARNVTEDLEIAGYKIPKGAIVTMQLHHVHRDPKHWPEPEKFDPDRFLPENSQGRHPYAYVPFSAGPRNCIGQKFSLLEQKTILTALLRTWRVKSLSKFNEAKCYNELILRPQNGIKIYFTRK